jgi:hypothetical protein
MSSPILESGMVIPMISFIKDQDLKDTIRSIISTQFRRMNQINLLLFNVQWLNIPLYLFSKPFVISTLLSMHFIEGVCLLRMFRYNILNPQNDFYLRKNLVIYTSIYLRVMTTSKYSAGSYARFFDVKVDYLKSLSPNALLNQWLHNFIPNRITILYKRLKLPFFPPDLSRSDFSFFRLEFLI